MRAAVPITFFLLVIGTALPAQSPAQTAAAGTKVWIGRYAEYEEFLRTAPIERDEKIAIGVTGPRRAFFAPGGLAASASVKRLPPGKRGDFYESYKSEIAAYKLDRMLQLDMVPPTVEREIRGEPVAIQLWIENTRMLKEVQAQKLHPPDPNAWNHQLRRVQVFDNLVGNIDPNSGNLLFDPTWAFVKIDHSRAFTGTRNTVFKLARIDREFYDRIVALKEEDLRREIGPLLETSGMPALLSRRQDIVKTFEKLVKEKGAAAVFEP